ncbi:DMT family transporter [Dokdonella sp. MW10]|uniref:DMT family transporter n=1 Tax=Dokdonella sp. MW10 TaxID=2992926 RepID=UPI003F8028E7
MGHRDTTLGIACGAGAGALWGLVFLAPALVSDFAPLQLTVGRYAFYGLLSLLLVAPLWRRLCVSLGRREWVALATLAFAGNALYYVLLASAVQLGGIAMTSLVIGFLPVAVTIIGSRDAGAVPLRRLAPSLLLCTAAALCIGWESVAGPASGDATRKLIGLLCGIGALVSWTWFAVSNSRWLARLPGITAHEWNLLIGVMTGAQALLLAPVALVLYREPHAAQAWAMLAGVSIGVAVLASLVGNALWNRMSRLLPLTLVGQMILFETVFALLYGLAWERRWPTLLESVAFALVVLGVLSCLAAHRTKRENRPALADA